MSKNIATKIIKNKYKKENEFDNKKGGSEKNMND